MPITSSTCSGRVLRAAPLALAAFGAHAQTAEPDTPSTQRVEIVGSHLKRVDAENALPVQIITRQDIERSGALGIDDLMSRITANFGGRNEALGLGDSGSPGFSGASLRGLDSRSTLVLLNGRRLANHAFSNEFGIGVDLHAIPLAAVERIEILTDGASAIYGSDAIAGAINFILRRDFRGAEASIERSATERGGGSRHRETLALGIGDAARDGFNAFAVLDHDVGHALPSQARDFASTGYRPELGLAGTPISSFPANIPLGGFTFANPAAPDCTASTVYFRGGCFFDYVRLIDLLPPTDRLGLLARATRSTGAQGELVLELVASRQQTLFKLAPTPANRFALASDIPLVIPESSPYYPQGLGLSGDIVDPAYRTLPLGSRTSLAESRQWRALLGWQGVLAGWDVDAALARSLSRATNRFVSGYVDSQRLVDAFQTGLINPFGDSGPAGNTLLASTQVFGLQREATASTSMADARASRDIAQWSAGLVTLGLGVEARRESLGERTTELAERVAGEARVPLRGERRAEAVHAELVLPLAKAVDAQLALRTDHYSDFGTASNPKVALRWQASQRLLLRASVGRGFRAPSLPELYTSQAAELSFIPADPLRCPVTGFDSDCGVFAEKTVVVGGNPRLGPERSRQHSFGLVLEPAAGWSAGIERWHIAIDDAISPLAPETVLAGGGALAGNVVRGPVDPAFPDVPGPITELILIATNVGRQVVSGIDVDLRWRGERTAIGRFGVRLVGSYLSRWSQSFDGVDENAGLDEHLSDTPFARWRHSAAVDWERGAWNATLTQFWQSGYRDAPAGLFFDLPARRVAPYRVWDAQLGYTGMRGYLTLALGVKNLFDRDPPFTRQPDSFQLGYDPGYADPRGRTFYARASYRWR